MFLPWCIVLLAHAPVIINVQKLNAFTLLMTEPNKTRNVDEKGECAWFRSEVIGSRWREQMLVKGEWRRPLDNNRLCYTAV